MADDLCNVNVTNSLIMHFYLTKTKPITVAVVTLYVRCLLDIYERSPRCRRALNVVHHGKVFELDLMDSH